MYSERRGWQEPYLEKIKRDYLNEQEVAEAVSRGEKSDQLINWEWQELYL